MNDVRVEKSFAGPNLRSEGHNCCNKLDKCDGKSGNIIKAADFMTKKIHLKVITVYIFMVGLVIYKHIL